MPGLKPIVYLGRDFFGMGEENIHHFQDTVSVLVHGLVSEFSPTKESNSSLPDGAPEVNVLVSSCTEEEVGVSVLSVDEAAQKVSEAASRGRQLGFPKLRKSEGIWKC